MTKNNGNNTVVYSDLIQKFIQRCPDLNQNDAKDITHKIITYMSEALGRGERVEIRGFGSFCLRQRKSRIARNPRTGEKIQLTERSALYFRPGKELCNSTKLSTQNGMSNGHSKNEASTCSDEPSQESSSFEEDPNSQHL